NNTFSGGFFISSGTASVSSDANLGAGFVSLNGGTLQLTGSATFTKSVSLGSGISTFSVAPGVSTTWNGNINQSELPSAVRFTGGGTIALNPTFGNFWALGTLIDGNTRVNVTGDAALGGVTASPLFLGSTTSGGTLGINGAGFS